MIQDEFGFVYDSIESFKALSSSSCSSSCSSHSSSTRSPPNSPSKLSSPPSSSSSSSSSSLSSTKNSTSKVSPPQHIPSTNTSVSPPIRRTKVPPSSALRKPLPRPTSPPLSSSVPSSKALPASTIDPPTRALPPIPQSKSVPQSSHFRALPIPPTVSSRSSLEQAPSPSISAPISDVSNNSRPLPKRQISPSKTSNIRSPPPTPSKSGSSPNTSPKNKSPKFCSICTQKRRWKEIFEYFDSDLDSIPWNNKQIKLLIRRGIPTRVARSKLWVRLLGVENIRKDFSEDYYSELLEKAKTNSIHIKPITRDLPRSLPQNIKFQSDEGKEQLKDILLVYSEHNPDVGYCQGINLIAATLLIFFKTEPAFWVLATIIQKYMDDYFRSSAVVGALVEQYVFQELFGVKFPELSQHLDELGVPLLTLCGQWFLVLYIHVLPWETTFRVWDILFSEGKDVLLSIGLGIFGRCESDILKCQSVNEIFEVMSRTCRNFHDADTLIENASTIYHLNSSRIEELRQEKRTELEAVIYNMGCRSGNTENNQENGGQNNNGNSSSSSSSSQSVFDGLSLGLTRIVKILGMNGTSEDERMTPVLNWQLEGTQKNSYSLHDDL